jgi:hypothetical protein
MSAIIPLAVAGVGLGATVAGFGAAGIAVGSIAAGIQSSIGNVAAGSLFATMQSLGATGTTFSAMTTGGIAVTAGSATVAAVQGKKHDSLKDNSNSEKDLLTQKKQESD